MLSSAIYITIVHINNSWDYIHGVDLLRTDVDLKINTHPS